MRSLCTATKSSPHLTQLEKAHRQQWRPNTIKNKISNLFLNERMCFLQLQCGKNVLHPVESLVLCCITNLFEVNFLYTAEVFHSPCRTQSYNFVFKPFTFNVKEFKPAILLCCCFFSLLIFCYYVFSLGVTSLYFYFFKDIF